MRPLRALPPGGEPLALRDVLHAARGSGASFAQALAGYLRASHCTLASSGTAALTLALKALGTLRPKRREVILPAYTCPHVLTAVVLSGLKPVLCDVNRQGTGLEMAGPAGLEAKLGGQTLAVVVVHLFGVPANLAEVAALARPQGAFVVEDAAQALGNELEGRRLGTLGDVGVFSFGRGKPLTLGSGGALVTNSAEVAQAASTLAAGLVAPGPAADAARALLYALFFRPGLYWLPRALPCLHLGETIFTLDIKVWAMSGFAAALGERLLAQLEQMRRGRAERAQHLMERLCDGRTVEPLGRLSPGNAYLRLPLLVAEGRRDGLLARLSRLGMSGMYPAPLNELPGTAAHLGSQAAQPFPHARALARRLLTVPLHGLLAEGDQQEIECALHGIGAASVAEPIG